MRRTWPRLLKGLTSGTARKARNPRTGEKVDVPPKHVVTFKPGKEMEERVRQLTEGESETVDDSNLTAGNGAEDRGDAGVALRIGKARKTT